MLVDGAGGGQDDILIRHGEAAAGNGHVLRGPVRHRVTGLFRLGRNSNRAAGILAAVKCIINVIDLAVQLIRDIIRGLLPLSRQGIVCVAAIRIHLDLVTGPHERLSIRQQPAQEGIVGASGLFRDYRVHAIDHKAGIGKGCSSLDGTTVGVINHLGGALGIAPLRRQGYAAFGNGNGVAGIIDLAVCAGLPAQEELFSIGSHGRFGSGLQCLDLGLGAVDIAVGIHRSRSRSAVELIGNKILSLAAPLGVQRHISLDRRGKVKPISIGILPAHKVKAFPDRCTGIGHRAVLHSTLGSKRHIRAIVHLEGDGVAGSHKFCIQGQIAPRHHRIGAECKFAVLIAARRGIPACKSVSLRSGRCIIIAVDIGSVQNARIVLLPLIIYIELQCIAQPVIVEVVVRNIIVITVL